MEAGDHGPPGASAAVPAAVASPRPCDIVTAQRPQAEGSTVSERGSATDRVTLILVQPDHVTLERSSVPTSTTCHSVGSTTTGNHTLEVE